MKKVKKMNAMKAWYCHQTAKERKERVHFRHHISLFWLSPFLYGHDDGYSPLFFYFQVNLTWIVVVMIMIIVVCCELLLLLQVAQCRCISTWIDFTWEIMDNPFFPLLWLLHLYSLWTLHYNMMGCYAVVSE